MFCYYKCLICLKKKKQVFYAKHEILNLVGDEVENVSKNPPRRDDCLVLNLFHFQANDQEGGKTSQLALVISPG